MRRIAGVERFDTSQRPKFFDLFEDRDDLLYLARLAASGGRFEHMYDCMKRLIEIVEPVERLTVQERKCFSLSCSAHIKDKRDAYYHVAKIAADCAGIDQKRADAAKAYLPLMAKEIDSICRDVVNTLNVYFLEHLRRVCNAATAERMIIYRTLNGDFLRYLAEVNTGSASQRYKEAAHEAYRSAKKDEGRLPAAHPTRLDMRFRLAHFLRNILKKPYEGYQLARSELRNLMAQILVNEDADRGLLLWEETSSSVIGEKTGNDG